MKLFLKWTIPVDDKAHIVGGGPVLHVASQFGSSDEVHIWTEEVAEFDSKRLAQIVATGQVIPDDYIHLGSVIVQGGHLVWHVVQVPHDSKEHEQSRGYQGNGPDHP